MAIFPSIKLSSREVRKILDSQEGHFCDIKSKDIAPAKLSRSISAFANAEGGELFIGISEGETRDKRFWAGFDREEDANGHIQLFNELFPVELNSRMSFLEADGYSGSVLKLEVPKSSEIKKASGGDVYVRKGAQNLPVLDMAHMEVLKLEKGISSFENATVNACIDTITNSEIIIRFMLEVVPFSEPDAWLRKQRVVVDSKPTAAGVILFAEEPQAVLPKRCGIKVYRYKTTEEEGSRESLDFDPISVEGCAYDQIKDAVKKTVEIIESARIRAPDGLKKVTYPFDAIHEIVTNAVLHRDYSIADDIHIKIFDNRVEVLSPGTLPGHITPENILKERFARNGTIVRLINKFPDPPNKDIGEGLNTAFEAMRKMKLKNPIIAKEDSYVKVTLKHESLASPEEMVLEYLQDNKQIANKEARDICFIGSENKMKTILQRMVKQNLIERVPGTTRYNAAYRKPTSSK